MLVKPNPYEKCIECGDSFSPTEYDSYADSRLCTGCLLKKFPGDNLWGDERTESARLELAEEKIQALEGLVARLYHTYKLKGTKTTNESIDV